LHLDRHFKGEEKARVREEERREEMRTEERNKGI
jgi:hypothetical protein